VPGNLTDTMKWENQEVTRMRRIGSIVLLLIITAGPLAAADIPFLRGDANVDG